MLFSKERRRRGRLDWTRRWGVLCSYVVLLLSAVQVLFLIALVLAGVAALLLSLPLKYQPPVTRWFIDVSTCYLRHGPHPHEALGVVLVAFSATTVLLACVPLFTALRSSGPKRLAVILVAPLALFSLMHLERAGRAYLGRPGVTDADVYPFVVYFWPRLPLSALAGVPPTWWAAPGDLAPGPIAVEGVKWGVVLAIAMWLSVAQIAARRHGRSRPPPTPRPRGTGDLPTRSRVLTD
jgi:hypothetical protein